MNKKSEKVLTLIKIISGFYVIAILIFFVWGQTSLPKENIANETELEMFEETWYRIYEDGSREPVTLPGQLEAEYGEWITVSTKLPVRDEYICMCFRSLQQDYKIYVDGELRKEYSTLDTQLFGKTSTMAYFFLELGPEDTGKEITVEFMSDSFYSGFMSDIFIGDKSDVVWNLVKLYAPATLVAIFMFLLSLSVIFLGVVVYINYKRNSELFYLGMGVFLATAWLICESKLRQFFLPNSTIAMYMGFLIIMILPYPFLMYANIIQKRRYEKAYEIVCGGSLLNLICCTMLQVLEIKDFFETMTWSHIVLIITIVFIVACMVIDVKRGYVKQYQFVAIGCACFFAAGIWEVYLSYVENSPYNGIALCIGLILLILMAVANVGKGILNIEKEKQVAVAASESKAQFLANMSHEIRTPINTMLGMNSMILKENTDETIAEYASNVDEAGKMLLGLVNTILDFSKIEAGKLELVNSEYSSDKMLKNVVLGVEQRTKNKGLVFESKWNNIPQVLYGDELRIKQIFTNLLSNAVKYTDEGYIKFIVDGVYIQDTFVIKASVEDTGKGIKEEDLKNLFDSFKRLELSKNRNIEGTGLGLSIVKQLTEMMGGKLNVTSEYGKGSCFSVEIPQKVVEKTLKNINTIKTEEYKNDDVYTPDAKILAVDDNEMNLKVIAAFLKISSAQLDFAQNGKLAIDMTKQKKYDLILMDHMMPEMDGIEALHCIRNDKSNMNCETKIIVLTANAIAGVEKQYLDEGFNGYISKPFEIDVFQKTIKDMLDV